MSIIAKTLLVLVVAAIYWMWFWTIPQCLSSGWGTPGYWATAHSVSDDQGPFGCWWGAVTRDRVRAQAFEDWARDGERLERERRAR
ncbi:MAG: hypothetical protein JO213_02055 [Alphaproteobacteria bacterium]|nr:hypothetical protein [Alphaproteobacteria bacterium]